MRNTSKSVEIFKQKLRLLNEIKQSIYREDYKLSKPDGECYELAKKKYIIGFEDIMIGYTALKQYTDIIYKWKFRNKILLSSIILWVLYIYLAVY